MKVLGMISGTSHDGIDVAVCDFRTEGEVLHVRVEHLDTVAYAAGAREAVVAALPPGRVGAGDLTRLDTLVGQEFARVARKAIVDHGAGGRGAGAVEAVCSHGQTVFHWVEDGRARGTLQVGQPAWIAEATGLPVVSDLRAADIAAGGQGAPLVCLLDQLALAGPAREETVAALNLGGIANLTVCGPSTAPLAWDVGPANALVDAVVAADPGTPLTFDVDGELAASGSVVPGLLEVLLDEAYYRLSPPKSTGKELFHLDHVRAAVERWGGTVELADLCATLVALTARTVAQALRAAGASRVFASGGGVRNPVLLKAIRDALPGVPVDTSDVLGLDPDGKEAIAFALIGWATLHGVPGNVPSCTGASGPRVLGRVSPPPSGGGLPVAFAQPPTRLVVERLAR